MSCRAAVISSGQVMWHWLDKGSDIADGAILIRLRRVGAVVVGDADFEVGVGGREAVEQDCERVLTADSRLVGAEILSKGRGVLFAQDVHGERVERLDRLGNGLKALIIVPEETEALTPVAEVGGDDDEGFRIGKIFLKQFGHTALVLGADMANHDRQKAGAGIVAEVEGILDEGQVELEGVLLFVGLHFEGGERRLTLESLNRSGIELEISEWGGVLGHIARWHCTLVECHIVRGP